MNIENLPFFIREYLYEKVSQHLAKKSPDKYGEKVNRLEKSLTRFMVLEWSKTANKAVNGALSVIRSGNQEIKVSKQQSDRMIKRIDSAFSGFEKKIDSRFQRDAKEIYRTNKVGFQKKFKLETKKNKQLDYVSKVGTFSTLDEQLWEKIAHLGVLSVSNRYPFDLKRNVQRIITEDVFKSGLNKNQASKFLTRELTRLLGPTKVVGADPRDVEIGLERTNQYFKGLTGTNTTFLESVSNTGAMQEAGIARYQIAAILDNLTSQICLSMNGMIFELKYAVEFRDKVLEVETISQLKEFAPWRKDLSEFGIKTAVPSAAEVLAAAGMAAPPYHFRCRTSIYPA